MLRSLFPTRQARVCSDEAVFDVGVGELFVVRTAGHVLAQASTASVRFAVEKLGARMVVVLGHEDCGAVQAALSADSPGWLAPIIDHIEVVGAAYKLATGEVHWLGEDS